MSTAKKLVTLNGLVVQHKLPYKRSLAVFSKLTPVYEQPFGDKVARYYDNDDALRLIETEFKTLISRRKNAEIARAALEVKRKALSASKTPVAPPRVVTPVAGGNGWTSLFASVDRLEKKVDELLNQLGVKLAA